MNLLKICLKNCEPYWVELSCFIGKSYFEEHGTQKYLLFQPTHRYFKITNAKYISSWKPKGLSDETITPYATSDNSPTPLVDHYGSKVRVKLFVNCKLFIKFK